MRILVIEDEPDLRRGLVQALREEGYAVDEAGDGEEGLYKASSWDYDALVLDLMLPRIDGWEVLRRLRRQHKTPVLILQRGMAYTIACAVWTAARTITLSSPSCWSSSWHGFAPSSAGRRGRPSPPSRWAS